MLIAMMPRLIWRAAAAAMIRFRCLLFLRRVYDFRCRHDAAAYAAFRCRRQRHTPLSERRRLLIRMSLTPFSSFSPARAGAAADAAAIFRYAALPRAS